MPNTHLTRACQRTNNDVTVPLFTMILFPLGPEGGLGRWVVLLEPGLSG
jgi:hypothetical protein